MKRFASMSLAHTVFVTAVIVCVLACVPLARGSAEDAAEERPASPPTGGNVVEAGVLTNHAHGVRFPVPKGFELRASSTSDEIVLTVPDCSECILRVLVSPGNTESLEATIRALKKQVASDPTARVLDEQHVRVAREAAYTLVKEEIPEAPDKAGTGKADAPAARIITRYVTFNHGADKYYFVLREPSARFGADEDAFDRLLAKLRFDS